MKLSLFVLIAASATVCFAETETTDPRLAKFLARFPEADLDGDGTLTMDEATRFRQAMRQGPRPAGDAGGARHAEPKPPGERIGEEELAAVFEAREFDDMPYRFFEPEVEAGKLYPLVVSLHGAGGKGRDNRKNLKPWLGSLVDDTMQQRHPCYIVAPQSPDPWRVPGSEPEITPELQASFPEVWKRVVETRGGFITPVENGKLGTVFALLDQLEADYPIDPDRVYVLGHSMGGFGTFKAIATQPERFAAAIPSAGGLAPWHDPATFKHVPVWAFHGTEDRTVIPELSEAVFDRMTEVGGLMKFTRLGGVGHGAAGWAFVYTGDSMNGGFSTEVSSDACDPTEDIWEWLFSKRRG